MRKQSITFLFFGLLLYAQNQEHNRLTPQEQKEGYVQLFNGKNLDGWSGSPGLWFVENGSIVGSTDGHPITANTFLIHDGTFSNFILKADIKLRNHNSGIQFRSERIPGDGFVVKGYQADASEVDEQKSAWGNFYEERGRGRNVMKTTDEGWIKAKPVVRHGDWNSLEVLAEGERMRISLNGVVTVEVKDAASATGIIALQVHAGPAMRVELRNLRLQRLP